MRSTSPRNPRSALTLAVALLAAASLGGASLADAGNPATPRADGAGTTRATKAAAKRFLKAEAARPVRPKLTRGHLLSGFKHEVRGADGQVFREAVEFPAGSLPGRLAAFVGLKPIGAVPFYYHKTVGRGDGTMNFGGVKFYNGGSLASKMFNVNGVHGYAQTTFTQGRKGAEFIQREESIGATEARNAADPTVERRVSRVDGKLRVRSSYSRKLPQLNAKVEYRRNEDAHGDDATHTFSIRTGDGEVYVAVSLDPNHQISLDAKDMKAGRDGRMSIFASKAAVASLKDLISRSKQLSEPDKARLFTELDAAQSKAF